MKTRLFLPLHHHSIQDSNLSGVVKRRRQPGSHPSLRGFLLCVVKIRGVTKHSTLGEQVQICEESMVNHAVDCLKSTISIIKIEQIYDIKFKKNKLIYLLLSVFYLYFCFFHIFHPICSTFSIQGLWCLNTVMTKYLMHLKVMVNSCFGVFKCYSKILKWMGKKVLCGRIWWWDQNNIPTLQCLLEF